MTRSIPSRCLDIAGMVRGGQLAAREVAEAYLDRVARLDPEIGAFLRVDPDLVRARADQIDGVVAAGVDPGPLAGVPVALKDNLCTRALPTTCGSRILEGFVPPYDATVVSRLDGAGAVLLGKTNLDEFAMGSSCENSALQRTVNPADHARVPGGSSGGSAAAVAAGLAPGALGTDTGGSIRQPAALCGVAGLKPTYGRVSRHGLIAFASSLDVAGPIAADAADCALIYAAIAGPDPADSTSIPDPVEDPLAGLEEGVAGMRLGLPREYLDGVAPEVAAPVSAASRLLEGLGARLVDVSLPHTQYVIPAYYIIATAEASSNLARYDGVHYGLRAGDGELAAVTSRTRAGGFGPEVKRRIMLGTFCLSAGYQDAYYLRALRARTLIGRDFAEAFREVDALICPTSPVPAFRLGEKFDDPLEMYLCDVLTAGANLAGIPALSVCCGSAGGLPVGLQVMGPPLGEALVLRVARAFERAA